MKKKNVKRMLAMLAIVIAVIVTVAGCKKGVNGTNGTNGLNGAPGLSVSDFCKDCHQGTLLYTNEQQYQHSLHYTNKVYLTEGTNGSCCACHSDQGFREACATDNYGTESDPPNPPANYGCFTCHNHDNFDTAISGPFLFRQVGPFTLRQDTVPPSTWSINKGSYTCARCHQARVVTPAIPTDYAAILTDSTKPTSVHYGTHEGVAANIFAGKGTYEFVGNTPYQHTYHAQNVSCGQCHIRGTFSATSDSTGVGGHSFEPQLNACLACHPTATSFDVDGKGTLITNLVTSLADALHNKFPYSYTPSGGSLTNSGLMEKVNGVYTGNIFDSGVPSAQLKKWPAWVMAAAVNCEFCIRNSPEHDYLYENALLQNTLDFVNAH